MEHTQENRLTVPDIVEAVAPSLMYTFDSSSKNQESPSEAVSTKIACDILSICLIEYEHIFVETS